MTNAHAIKLFGGFFGFLICCFVAFIANNPNGPALMVLPTLILMWVGGMGLLGLAATELSRVETDARLSSQPIIEEGRPAPIKIDFAQDSAGSF